MHPTIIAIEAVGPPPGSKLLSCLEVFIFLKRQAATVSATFANFCLCFRACSGSLSTANISFFEYPIFTTPVRNVIFFSHSQEEPTLTLLGVASTPVLGVLSTGSGGLVCRVAPAPGPVTPAVLPAVTLRLQRYFSKLCKRHFLAGSLVRERDTLSLSVLCRLGTQGICEMVWMGAGDLSLLILLVYTHYLCYSRPG